jgi:hypothetical protein
VAGRFLCHVHERVRDRGSHFCVAVRMRRKRTATQVQMSVSELVNVENIKGQSFDFGPP